MGSHMMLVARTVVSCGNRDVAFDTIMVHITVDVIPTALFMLRTGEVGDEDFVTRAVLFDRVMLMLVPGSVVILFVVFVFARVKEMVFAMIAVVIIMRVTACFM